MNRVAFILVLLLFVPAHAQPVANAGFDPALVTHVYAAALTFMAPRTLDAVPVSTLTVWGLRGLTALDPNLIAEQHDGKLHLAAGEHELIAVAPPAGEAPEPWAAMAVQLSRVAVTSSAAVRRAGTQGILQSFFDELFNHLDPYSRYVAPRDASEDRARRNGTAGLGITVAEPRKGTIVVRTLVSDGPAAQAGVRQGDVVMAIDSQPMRGLDAALVTGLIDGPEGTKVTMRWRGHDGRPREAQMTRAMVPPESVFSERLGDTLVLRITSFNHSTAMHMAQALEEGLASASPPAGIVLDLRGNRGGLLREAVEAADALLPDGVVVTTAGRDPGANHVWRSGSGELAEGLPLVVLVDGRTASAAEILAAALADRGRAVVAGSTTLGKGLVQTIEPLPDGGELFVTWSRVLAPLGWPIQGLGVVPQVCTSLGESPLHRQLSALAEGMQPMAHAIAVHREARAPLTPAHIVAIRAACPAAEGRDTDLATARILIGNPAAYAAALLPPLREVVRR